MHNKLTSSSKKSNLFKHLFSGIWNLLTKPKIVSNNPVIRYKTRLLSTFLIILILIFFQMTIRNFITNPNYIIPLPMVGVYIFLVVIYVLNRSKYYTFTALLTIVLLPIITFFLIISNVLINSVVILSILLLTLFLGSVLLSIQNMISVNLVNIITIILITKFSPTTFSDNISAIFLILMTSIFTVVFIYYRNKIEKERKTQLQKTEARFKSLTETTTAATFIYQNQQIRYVNSAAESLIGYTRKELLGMNFWDMLHPRFREILREEGELLQKSNQPPERYELKLLAKNGEERWVDYTTTTIEFEEQLATLGTAFDITERKQAEKALQESEEKWRSLIENVPDSIITINLDGIILSTNLPNIEDIVGKTAYSLISSEQLNTVKQAVNKVLETGNTQTCQLYITNPDKSQVWYLSRIGPIKNREEIVALIVISTDITERKRTEELLIQYRDHLEEMVVKRTQESREAIENLKKTQHQLVQSEKMAALGQLVAGVAHEINTPVSIGITMASTLAEETQQFVEIIKTGKIKLSSLKSYLQVASESSNLILSNLNRAAKLVQGFKQVAVNQSKDEKRLFKIKTYLEEILLSLKPKLKRFKHSIEIEVDDELSLYSYPNEFSQIITNLIINSLQHAYEEGDKAHLNFKIEKVNKSLKLEYNDDGVGIPTENIPKIFDPFFTTARSSGGSGLGLHVVYNLVTQKLKGNIECKSKLGCGTKFIINLPLRLED